MCNDWRMHKPNVADSHQYSKTLASSDKERSACCRMDKPQTLCEMIRPRAESHTLWVSIDRARQGWSVDTEPMGDCLGISSGTGDGI